MRDNMLISVKGHKNHYMGVDLNMEHIIGFQKVWNSYANSARSPLTCFQEHFTGKGVHGTAKHLARLSPMTAAYRTVRTKFYDFGGVSYYGSSHTEPKRTTNINLIRRKLEEGNMYSIDMKRSSVTPTKDVIYVSIYAYMLFYCSYTN